MATKQFLKDKEEFVFENTGFCLSSSSGDQSIWTSLLNILWEWPEKDFTFSSSILVKDPSLFFNLIIFGALWCL